MSTYISNEIHSSKLFKRQDKTSALVNYLFNNYVHAIKTKNNKVDSKNTYLYEYDLSKALIDIHTRNSNLKKEFESITKQLPVNKSNAADYEQIIQPLLKYHLSDDEVDAYWDLKELYEIANN